MFPYFVVSDTNYDSITSLLATQIIYFGPFRGVMKIRIAVTLVVLGLLHLGPGKGPGSSLEHLSTLISTINSTKHIIEVPDELSARALKHRYMACYGTRLSLSLSTTEKRQNVTFLTGYNSRTV